MHVVVVFITDASAFFSLGERVRTKTRFDAMIKLITKAANNFAADRCPTLAAALAFYTIFALPPLLYLLLTLLTVGLSLTFGADEAERRAQSLLEYQAAEMFGNEAAEGTITKILDANLDMTGRFWSSLISFGGIIVGATGVVAAIQDSLNRVWSVKPDPNRSGVKNFFLKRLLSLGMILGLGFVLLISLIVTAALSWVGNEISERFGMDETVTHAVSYAVQGLISFVIIASIFKFMPDAKVHWKDVFVGAFLTTILILLGRLVLQWYLGRNAPGLQFGSAAASLVAVLVWVYYSSMVFLFGAEATQVYAVDHGSGIEPVDHAVRFVEQIERR